MEVGAAITAIKAAIDAARAAKDVHDQAQLDAAISEITKELTNAQSDLLSMIVQQQELVEENRRLREEMAKEARFERYRLVETPMGDFILQLKEEHVTDEEPAHAICTYCSEEGRLSYLSKGSHRYRCSACRRSAWIEPLPKGRSSRTISPGV